MNIHGPSPSTATGGGHGRHLALLLTCEHAGNRVPPEYAALFASRRARAALDTHRGYDIGSLRLARRVGRTLGVAPIASTVTRLLVDANRSRGHPSLFSEFSRGLGEAERERVLERYYAPHRRRVEAAARGHLAHGRSVLHLSVHSFTPRLEGRSRTADVGLLYDPAREGERDLCARWRTLLLNARSDLRIRRNYPYLGRSDGLTTHLRRELSAGYLGIELEVNQALVRNVDAPARSLAAALADSLGRILGGDGRP